VHGRSDRLRAGRINSVIESISVEHLRFCSQSSGRFNRFPHRELASFRRASQQSDCGADIDARLSTNDVLIGGEQRNA
jgi:hypothetical protein